MQPKKHKDKLMAQPGCVNFCLLAIMEVTFYRSYFCPFCLLLCIKRLHVISLFCHIQRVKHCGSCVLGCWLLYNHTYIHMRAIYTGWPKQVIYRFITAYVCSNWDQESFKPKVSGR